MPILLLLAFSIPAAAQEVGPENGALVIVGGAMRDRAIVDRFLDLAGGPDAPIVMIPTAGGEEEYDQYWSGLRQFKDAGATDLFVLHTNDRDCRKFRRIRAPAPERAWRLVRRWPPMAPC